MEPSIEIKARLFRECDAMVLYITARGIEKEMPKVSMLSLLDKSSDARVSVPMGEILHLHQTLTRIVSPAFPETIMKLQDFQKNRPWWSMFAPLRSIFWLIVTTIALIVSVGWSLSSLSDWELPDSYFEAQGHINGAFDSIDPAADDKKKQIDDIVAAMKKKQGEVPFFEPVIEYLQGSCRFTVEELAAANKLGSNPDAATVKEYNAKLRQHFENCQTARRPILLRLFLFFGALGMLGAAYSSIYDSFSYIRDGRYDLRLASTYYVRILLGGFSGVLLAEPLSEFLEGGVISSALLAFLGGFSAQLVYDLLTKLVDSVANLFRADRRKEQQSILAQAEFNAREIVLEEDAAKRHGLAKILTDAQKEIDPKRRAEMMQDSVLNMLSGKFEPRNLDGESISGTPLLASIHRGLALSEVTSHLADLLPDAGPDLSADSTAAKDVLANALKSFSTLGTAKAQSDVETALSGALATELASERLARGVSDLGTAVKGDALRAIAKIALAADSILPQETIARWRHVAYDAVSPSTQLLEGLDPVQFSEGLTGSNGIEISPTETINSVLTGDSDHLISEGGFADKVSFDTAISSWIDMSVRRTLEVELEAPAVSSLTRTSLTGAQILEALNALHQSDTACGGLQVIELIGGAVTKCINPKEILQEVCSVLDVKLEEAGQ